MQTTSSLYKQITSGKHRFEVSLAIGERGRLLTQSKHVLTFGGTSILVDRGGGESGYRENILKSIKITRSLFSDNSPAVGQCVAAEIDVEMLEPVGDLPRMSQIAPYVRAVNDSQASEWIQQGVFYIDTREKSDDGYSRATTSFHGYDAMLLTEKDYPDGDVSTSLPDIQAVQTISEHLGVPVDSRTYALMNKGYMIQYPSGYSCREVLGYIAAAYGGNFIISNLGELLLVPLNSIPVESRYLIDKTGYAITFGGDRILV